MSDTAGITALPEGAATTVGALLGEVAARLAGVRAVESPAFEAREIVAALHERPRFWPTVNAHVVVAPAQREAALRAAARRARGAPLQYAIGTAAFRHLSLVVDERVLIPRPETELLVDLVLELLRDTAGGVAVDVGTGSGAIALSLAAESRLDRIYGVDISGDALAVARSNLVAVDDLAASRVEFLAGAFLAPVPDVPLQLVVSNPPYIATGEAEALPAVVRDWEPAVALFSGPSGMNAIATLTDQAAARLAPGGWLAMEVDARRASTAAEIVSAEGRFEQVGVRLDLSGRERFVLARRRERE